MSMSSRALVLVCLLAGCGEQQSFSPGDEIHLTMQLELPAGAESYRCRLMRLPASDGEIFVSGGAHHYSPGVHHYLLFRTTLTAIPAGLDREVDCYAGDTVMRYARGYVTGGQTPDVSADFPPGVAYPFRGGEILLLQAHTQNSGAAALSAEIEVTLRTTASAAQRAGTLRFYNPYIHVPAHASAHASMRCPISRDITILSAAPHMHRRGVDFQIAHGGGEPFYRTSDWEQPATLWGPMHIAGGSRLEFRCGYANPSDRPVFQGLSAEADEMCMWSAIYYPALPEDEAACVGMDRLGSGDASCAATTSCLERCPAADRPRFETGSPVVGECWQRCITASCPSATSALFPQLVCTQSRCAAECAETGATCTACVVSRCAAEVDACQRLPCDGA